MPWFKRNPSLFKHEKEFVTHHQPSLDLEIVSGGSQLTQSYKLECDSAVCRGTYHLVVPKSDTHYNYSIIVITQSSHPQVIPLLYCNDPKLPIGNPDRHIEKDGKACLGVNTEINRKWRAERGMAGFFDDFVSPFLAWQLYYEAYGHAKPFGQRSHGAKGIIEYYSELSGFTDELSIQRFMELLARPNQPKGHESCVCGSGQRLRSCHSSLIWNTWGKIEQQDVQKDLETVRKYWQRLPPNA